MWNRGLLIWTLPLAALSSGCGNTPNSEVLLLGSLGNAIRATGFVCETVERAEEIEAADNDWRVSCDATLVYIASVREDGAICVEPVFHGDAAEGIAVRTPEARCTEPTTP